MPVKPEIECIDGFYSTLESEPIFRHFQQDHAWPDNRYSYGGRQFVLPRLQTWHADAGIRYSYSNNLLETRAWTPILLMIRAKVEAFLAVSFNAVLVNYYRDGEDYVGWHADDEPELGKQPLIASLTLGAERRFEFKRKHSAENGYLVLRNGTLLVMQPAFQHQWLHRVPKAHDVGTGRINLTFRQVVM
jgi:alkylated DNA repair dioxygenase AlkB